MAKKPTRRPSRGRASLRGAKTLPPSPHNVVITDTDENWLAWGKLVDKWIDNPGSRPTTVQLLRDAMDNANPRVYGTIKGNPGRGVQVVPYSGSNILIPIPTRAMVNEDIRILQGVLNNPPGQRNYPLPQFYRRIFRGAAMTDFTSLSDLEDMAKRRLGEYVINECM